MMERLRRRREEPSRPATVEPIPTSAPGGEEAALPRTGVEVVFGPYTESMNLEGMTFAAADALLRRGLNVPPELTALVNGLGVEDPQRALEPGDQLEFVRRSGEKG